MDFTFSPAGLAVWLNLKFAIIAGHALNLRVGFWQNGFLAGVIFEPPDFLRILSPDFCFAFLRGKSILQENPRQNPPKSIQLNHQHISAEGQGQYIMAQR